MKLPIVVRIDKIGAIVLSENALTGVCTRDVTRLNTLSVSLHDADIFMKNIIQESY